VAVSADVPTRRPSVLSRAAFVAGRWLRTSPAVARWLFGVTVERPADYLLWDLTTLALRRALAAHLRDGQSVLEVGTGPVAILTLHLARRPVRATATEVCPEFVASARAHAARNARAGAEPVTVVQGDLFENVPGRFDVIFINPPYLPEQTYETLVRAGVYEGFTGAGARSASSGGPSGDELIVRFFTEAPAHLNPGGRVLVGTNPRYLPEGRIAEIAAAGGLRLASVLRQRWNPSVVLVLEPSAVSAS
jgi:methylase of polypeptide subunit release factors